MMPQLHALAPCVEDRLIDWRSRGSSQNSEVRLCQLTHVGGDRVSFWGRTFWAGLSEVVGRRSSKLAGGSFHLESRAAALVNMTAPRSHRHKKNSSGNSTTRRICILSQSVLILSVRRL
jgi:hypothetical protein